MTVQRRNVHGFLLLALATGMIGCGEAKRAVMEPVVVPEIDPAPTSVATSEVTESLDAAADNADVVSQVESDSEVESGVSIASAAVMTADAEQQPSVAEVSVSELTEVTPEDPVAEEVVEPEPSGPPPIRLYLPTTSGTLLVDVDILLGDTPLREAYDQRIEKVIAEAGDDDLQARTWHQIFDHVSSDPQQFGRSQPINAEQYKDMIRRYDINRNKRPDPKEVAKVLFRSSGFAGPFRLSGTDHYRSINRSESKLFKAIDRDNNGALDADELACAGRSLMQIDTNSDQSIGWNEVLVTSMDNNDPAWDRRRTNRRGEVAMDLEGYIDWTIVSYSLDALRNNSPFGIDNHPLCTLDRNGNESVSGEEAKGAREVPGDVRLRVQFDGDLSGKPIIEVVSLRPELQSLVGGDDRSDSFTLAGRSLQFSVNAVDVRSGQNQVPPQVFDMLDADADGFLEESEIPDGAAEEFSFEKLDTNDDDKLTLQEINAGIRGAVPIWSVQVRGRAAEFPDGVFAWLDQNHDQVLSEREIMAAGQRLQREGSDPLRPSDIPDTFVVQIARGDPAQDNQTFQFSPPEMSLAKKLPRWAEKMDTNGDSDISKREFIGTSQQFDALDANDDGFIDPQEVLAYAKS